MGVTFARLQPQQMDTDPLLSVIDHSEETARPPKNARGKRRECYELHYQRRLALPLVPIPFALVGVPLGVRRTRGARSHGVLGCVVLVFGCDALLSTCSELADDGTLAEWVALWIPNALLAGAAGWLLYPGAARRGLGA